MTTSRLLVASAGYHLAGRALSQPDLAAVGLVVAVAGLIPGRAWRIGRLAITAVHEAGHAAVAVLSGRQVTAVHLRADSSGVTYHRGPVRRGGRLATAAAGYPAPTAIGVAGAWLIGHGDSRLWLGVLAGLGVLNAVLWVRNLFGILVVAAWVGAIVLLLHSASVGLHAVAGTVVVWYLAIGGLRAVVESGDDPRSGDMSELARVSHLPAAVWKAGFVVVTAAGLAGSAGLLFGRF